MSTTSTLSRPSDKYRRYYYGFTALSTLIGSVGFPIAACCFLFIQLSKQTETLNELKIVMTKLIDKLDVEDVDVRLKK